MKKKQKRERNWTLVVIASSIIMLNTILFAIAVMNISWFGWWSVVIALGALSSIALSAIAIKKNEPAWLLLDLILPS